jgi:hypothetical protein
VMRSCCVWGWQIVLLETAALTLADSLLLQLHACWRWHAVLALVRSCWVSVLSTVHQGSVAQVLLACCHHFSTALFMLCIARSASHCDAVDAQHSFLLCHSSSSLYCFVSFSTMLVMCCFPLGSRLRPHAFLQALKRGLISFRECCADSLITLVARHPLIKQRQRTQLLQCAVCAAALHVMHSCGVEITSGLLHQALTSLVATARMTQKNNAVTGSEEGIAALEKLHAQLEDHLRDLELRAALGADSNNNDTHVAPRADFSESAVPTWEQPGAALDVSARGGSAVVSRGDRSACVPGEGNGVDAGQGNVSPGMKSSTQKRNALLELAGRSGAALASGVT